MNKTEVSNLISTVELKSLMTGGDVVWKQVLDCIRELQSENAVLQAKLEKAIEVPCRPKDVVYIVHEYDSEDNFNPWIDKGVAETVSLSPELWIYIRFDSGLTMWYTEDTFKKEVFLTFDEAKSQLGAKSCAVNAEE